ncbi:MAG: helix-turn-helix transcriptional regulator, partial [Hyphomicrobiales bacterium]
GRVVDDAGVRPEVCLAVGSQEAFGLDQPVPENGEVHILPAIAGGAVATEELEGYAGRLGNEIRKHRLAAGMTQLELARAVGTSQARLSRIESGVDLPSLDLLHRLGTALGVEIDIRLRTAAAPA